MNREYRLKLIPTLARTSPYVFPIILFANCILMPSYESFYIFIMYFAVMLSNFFAKTLLFKPIYNFFGKTSIKFLGIGSRPKGANSCGTGFDGKDSNTFGMPSGHSQLAWAFAIYTILKLIQKIKNDKDINNNTNKASIALKYLWLCISCIIIIGVAFYISYSRVYIEGCHTIQQVIIGGLIGFGWAFLLYYLEDDIKKLLTL